MDLQQVEVHLVLNVPNLVSTCVHEKAYSRNKRWHLLEQLARLGCCQAARTILHKYKAQRIHTQSNCALYILGTGHSTKFDSD